MTDQIHEAVRDRYASSAIAVMSTGTAMLHRRGRHRRRAVLDPAARHAAGRRGPRLARLWQPDRRG